MNEILTPEQVAEYLQMNTDTIYRLIRRQELAATKIGRSYRIPREDLDRFMVSHNNRKDVRDALFRKALAFAERDNPGVDSEDVLEELEALDEERRARDKH